MRRLLITTALFVSIGAYAADDAKVEAPKEAGVVASHKEWPSLDTWFKTNNLNAGTLSAEILVGYEHSDLEGNGLKAANAFLTRTRLNYKTANMQGFDAFIQAQYVGPLNDHYSYPGNATGYDAVADPEQFRMHQAYLAYTGYDTHGRVGAQEIILDNARFIGNVGWRLNAQSFNAGSVKNESIENLKLYYAYADSINDIFGNTIHTRRYHMANAEYKLGDNVNASAFAYLQRNSGSGTDKIDTFGGRIWGKCENINHELMAAVQRDALYGSAFGELLIEQIGIGGGIEYIGGGETSREQFQTLNGTAHKFNGWADQFLGTGGGLRAGLVDIYGQVSATPVDKLKLQAVYHYFNTVDKTSAGGGLVGGFEGEYGQEIDLLAKYKVCKNFSALAKAAYYIKGDNHPDNFTADETVFWLRGILTF